MRDNQRSTVTWKKMMSITNDTYGQVTLQLHHSLQKQTTTISKTKLARVANEQYDLKVIQISCSV